MARLTDMLATTDVETNEEITENTLVQALEVLIEMVKENALTAEELDMIDTTVDYITESVSTEIEEDEELTEKKMSPKEKMQAKKYRLKNKAKLALIAKKKKACMAKIAGKTGMSCDSKGRPRKIDKARSRAARMGAKSR